MGSTRATWSSFHGFIFFFLSLSSECSVQGVVTLTRPHVVRDRPSYHPCYVIPSIGPSIHSIANRSSPSSFRGPLNTIRCCRCPHGTVSSTCYIGATRLRKAVGPVQLVEPASRLAFCVHTSTWSSACMRVRTLIELGGVGHGGCGCGCACGCGCRQRVFVFSRLLISWSIWHNGVLQTIADCLAPRYILRQ